MRKKVHLIIGHKGFLGSNLLKLNFFKNKNKILFDIKDFNSKKISWSKSLFNLMKKKKPDFVWNMSGSYTNNFRKDLTTNVITNYELFINVIKLKLKSKILVIGSASEYGLNPKKNSIAVTEGSELKPNSIYSWSKISLFYLIKFFSSVHNLNIVYARIFNIYGKGITDKLFVGKINNLIKTKKLNIKKLRGLDSKRDYSSVKDVANKLRKIMLKGKKGHVYNVGSGKLTTNLKLINILFNKNHSFKKKMISNDNYYDVSYRSNNSKFKKL